MSESKEDFYVRYYVGHKGKFGHEFLEFEFRPDGKLRYANNSNYKNDTLIRKEVFLSKLVMEELKRIIDESEILKVASFFNISIFALTPLHSGERCRLARTRSRGASGAGDCERGSAYFIHVSNLQRIAE